jgi:hypothetical protein
MIAMWEGGNQLDAEAKEKASGVTRVVNRAAEKKRAERIAREAKQKKGK